MLPKIVVDADACPVKDEIRAAGKKHGIEVLMVASFDHRLIPEDGVQVVQVDRSDQSADLYIANHLQGGDVLITQDFGLAAIGLGKGAYVLSNRGQNYKDETMAFLLEQRHRNAKLRRKGRYGKGPKPFTDEDRHFFLHALTKLLTALQEIEPG
ncbi:MAG TPA: YaiI/YqxD family protein [Bacilli bacterium]